MLAVGQSVSRPSIDNRAVSRRNLSLPSARRSVLPPRNATAEQDSRAGSGSDPGTSYAALQSYHYGRAFATVLSRRIGEQLVDFIGAVSRRIVERPQRIKDFQEEVELLARRGLGLPEPSTGGTVAGRDINDVNSRYTNSAEPLDLQAVVDEIRAEAASARHTLQQIKLAKAAATVV